MCKQKQTGCVLSALTVSRVLGEFVVDECYKGDLAATTAVCKLCCSSSSSIPCHHMVITQLQAVRQRSRCDALMSGLVDVDERLPNHSKEQAKSFGSSILDIIHVRLHVLQPIDHLYP